MKRTDAKGLPRPTEAELAILRALWDLGPSTVRDVHEEVNRDESAGYTTTLKLLQVMHAKGLVQRDDSQRAHIYRPAMSKDFTQGQMVDHLVNRVFGGSSSELVLHALGGGEGTSAEELAKIRALLEDLEKRSE